MRTVITSFLVFAAAAGAQSLEINDPLPADTLGKLGTPVHRVEFTAHARGLGASTMVARDLGLAPRGPRVLVTLTLTEGTDAESVLGQVEATGAQVSAADGPNIDVYMDPTGLKSLAALPFVERVDAPQFATKTALPPGAPYPMGEQQLHTKGITGRGVKVGLIDLGFAGSAAAMTSGFTLLGPAGTGDHGTCCAKVIQAVAPGATIDAVVSPGSSDAGAYTMTAYRQTVKQLIRRGCKVISSSMSFVFGHPLDGSSDISRTVDEASQQVVWAQSAGNYALGNYAGRFTDPDGNGFHEFRPTRGAPLPRPPPPTFNVNGRPFTPRPEEMLPIGVEPGSVVGLTWDDWKPNSLRPRPANDLDLIIWVPGQTLSVGAERQVGRAWAPPREAAQAKDAGNEVPNAYLLVRRSAGSGAVPFRLIVPYGVVPAAYQTSRGSITVPADARGAITVAAWEPSHDAVAPYSSHGPTDDGRPKPDITAPTDRLVGAGLNGGRPFDGTSCAAPHIAGVAALMRQAHPDWSAPQVAEAIRRSVKPLPGYGPEVVGRGIIALEKASSTAPTPPGLPPGTPPGLPPGTPPGLPPGTPPGLPPGIPSPPAPPKPPPVPNDEVPMKISLASENPQDRLALHFTRPDGRDCWAGQPHPTWGKTERENPVFSVSGAAQSIQVTDLLTPGLYHIWAQCQSTAAGGKARAKLTVTGSEGSSQVMQEELATGDAWTPLAIRVGDKPGFADLVPRKGGAVRSVPEPKTIGTFWLERVTADKPVDADPSAPISASDRVRFHVKLSAPMHVYLAGRNAKGEPELYWPRAAGQALAQAGADFAMPATGTFSFDTPGARERIALVVSPQPLPDIEALAAKPGSPSMLSQVLKGDPGWGDTLLLLRGDAATPGRLRLGAPGAAGAQWAVIELVVQK